TEITIDTQQNCPGGDGVIANTCYNCGPDGLNFNTAVQLTIKYAQSDVAVGVDETQLQIAKAVTGGWDPIENSVADPNANEVTADINSFSIYAILGSPIVPQEEYVFESKWGTEGDANNEFGGMGGIAYESGTVYVTDMVPVTIERVQFFDADGWYLGQCQGWDDRAGAPGGITVDFIGDIYSSIADDVFTKTDNTCGLIFNREAADLGLASFKPSDVAVDAGGAIYVAEMINNRITKLDAGGNFVQTIGEGQFSGAGGVAVGPDGSIYASDHSQHRILKFDSSGTYVGGWGAPGDAPEQFQHPRGIDVDSNGDVYVADSVGNRVQKFDSDGNFITEFGEMGTGDGQFKFPTDVAVTPDGNSVYVCDTLNHRVQKFVRQP
ncbi:MAG: hypothetical protein R6V19_03135, partial [Armatimonadota bacterium]